MEISTREQDGCLVVGVAGRLDTDTAAEFERHCSEAIVAGHHRLVLDLAQLEYISSAGLRAILATAKRVKPHGGGLTVCSLAGGVADVFAISGFARLMPIVTDVPSALRAF